jgi:hypothetical protein
MGFFFPQRSAGRNFDANQRFEGGGRGRQGSRGVPQDREGGRWTHTIQESLEQQTSSVTPVRGTSPRSALPVEHCDTGSEDPESQRPRFLLVV